MYYYCSNFAELLRRPTPNGVKPVRSPLGLGRASRPMTARNALNALSVLAHCDRGLHLV
jgi:hypothetical protein